MKKISPIEKLSQVDQYWDPKVIAEFNGQEMRVARLKGEFVWHAHDAEDEVFWVLDGQLVIEFRDKKISLGPGEVLVIPRGVEHRPVAENEVKVVLLEPASTINTGNTHSPITKTKLDKI